MNRDAIDEAARWLAAHESGDVDWDEFTAWLEADTSHRSAYNELALIEQRVVAHRVELARQEPPVPERRHPWRWAGMAVGGLVAASLAFLVVQPKTSADAVWRSEANSSTIQVADGIVVRLAPRSILVARQGDPRRLDVTGTAILDVRHDPTRTLIVAAGPLIVRDIGTRFEVTAAPGIAHVAVAEGAVSASMRRAFRDTYRLAGGATLTDVEGNVTIGQINRTAVGGWERGVLTYTGAPLALVAADVERYSGKAVTIDPRLAGTRFSGVLTIGDGSKLAIAVATILGGEALPDGGGGIRLEPHR